MDRPKKFQTDVLVIGAGIAGLRAAIEAHDRGAKVLIVGKTARPGAHTRAATGGINAALGTMDPQDSWKVHAADTYREGAFLADWRAVQILCKEAPGTIREFVKWKVPFHREPDGRLTQRFFGAHTHRRTCFVGDSTGAALMEALLRQTRKRKIPHIPFVYITNLLKDKGKGKINGALGIHLAKRKLYLFISKAIILATGGYDRVYRITSTREVREAYGDGISLAYAAGAELQDMEMVQFHPTGMVWPKKHEGTLATEAMRAEGAYLLNNKGERFMSRYYPERMELGPRDIVARAIYSEIKAGRGSPHGGVWLDISHVPASHIRRRLPQMVRQFRELAGTDITKKPVEVAPTAHYSMGGVVIDFKSCAVKSVPDLFAAGEVTAGIHGANRLGGNSLADGAVFGRRAGIAAASLVKKTEFEEPDEKLLKEEINGLSFRLSRSGVSPSVVRSKIRGLMQSKAGIVRDRKGLSSALSEIGRLKKVKLSAGLAGSKRWAEAMEVHSMILVCEAILRSALMRKESRGAHFREDCPKADDKGWLCNIVCKEKKGKMRLFKRPVPKPPASWAKAAAKQKSEEYGYVE